MLEMAEEEKDEDTVTEAVNELATLKEHTDALELETLMRGDYDDNDAVLSLHAGAGGTEAQDWTSDALPHVYPLLREDGLSPSSCWTCWTGAEAGIESRHLPGQRRPRLWLPPRRKGRAPPRPHQSPFDANARRHTSFASLDVAPILEDDDADIEINMKDVRVDTYHSSGAGGQNVNRPASAVRMTHYPDRHRGRLHRPSAIRCRTARPAIKMLKAPPAGTAWRRAEEQQMADIKGEMKKIQWGSQIRSYVFPALHHGQGSPHRVPKSGT